MTNDLVASQQQSKDMDQGNRKRVAPKEELEEELTKKRLRDNASEQTAEAAEGKTFASHSFLGDRKSVV